MSETTFASPLSAEEVREAVKFDFDRALLRDCYMNPSFAYEAFEGEIHGKLMLSDNGRIAEVEIHLRFEKRPPNVVRERAGLGIPTLIEDLGGKKDVRNVKYSPPRGEKEAPELPEEEEPRTPKPPESEPKPQPKPAEPQQPQKPSTRVGR